MRADPRRYRIRRHFARRLRRLGPGAREDLLRVLASPPAIRADVIRQMYERRLDLADVLMDVEAGDLMREQVILILREDGS